MAKRAYWETIKTWGLKIGVPTSVGLILLFMYLQNIGAITITNYIWTSQCAGNLEEPCFLYINFTVNDLPITNEDVFIYKTNYDPYGRNTPFEFSVPLKDWKLERSWGKGWREINLEKGCSGSWCGCYWCRVNQTAEYSIVFREGRDYQIRITGYKYNITQDISWWFG